MRRNPVPSSRPGAVVCLSYPVDEALELPALVAQLASHEEPLVFLDSARQHPVTGRYSLVGWDPWLSLSTRAHDVTVQTSRGTYRRVGHPLLALREILRRYAAAPMGEPLPPIGLGLMGYLHYEMNRWIERLPQPQPPEIPMPEMAWYGMRQVIIVDHLASRSWCVSMVDPHQPVRRARQQAAERLERLVPWAVKASRDERPMDSEGPRPSGIAQTLDATMTPRQFEKMVRRALRAIAAGDIFQANLSQRFAAPWRSSAWSLYTALRHINPSPFACFLAVGDAAVVSCSPERLVRVREGVVEARPIAGTRPRGTTPDEDLLNSLELILSDKERAEHIMLVDLARNDLGRVSRYGSVRADALMTLEEYSHVIHIVSNVRGELKGGQDAVDVIRAMFPGGTITGCPKVRCMEIIRELEPVARGLYTGSIGVIGFDGTLDLNIAIRTMVLHNRLVSFHVGSGIVADSEPHREYQETLDKAAALMSALGLESSAGVTVDAVSR